MEIGRLIPRSGVVRLRFAMVAMMLLSCAAAADARVLCETPNHVIKARDFCKKRERIVDLTAFGLPAQGTAGVPGPTGAPGDRGTPGSPGAPGIPGAIGATGPGGSAGPTGAAGAPGAPGSAGAPGTPGSIGPTGPTGSPGSLGETPTVRDANGAFVGFAVPGGALRSIDDFAVVLPVSSAGFTGGKPLFGVPDG